MIEEFTKRWFENMHSVREQFAAKRPDGYIDIVKAVITAVRGDKYGSPDPERIHQIDDGHYQGTLVFVIAGGGYQPSRYWYCRINYGSCSVCDTLQALQGWGDVIEEREVTETMTLALHVVQQLREMGGEEV